MSCGLPSFVQVASLPRSSLPIRQTFPSSPGRTMRAIRDNEDSEAIVQAINAKLEKIRERRAALPAPDSAPEADPA